eukprot:s2307_g6.t1
MRLFLRRGAALAATADWLLREAEPATGQVAPMSAGMLREVERLFGDVEKELKYWAKLGGGPYFFETIAVNWPVWRMMNRAGDEDYCGTCPSTALYHLDQVAGSVVSPSQQLPQSPQFVLPALAPPRTPIGCTVSGAVATMVQGRFASTYRKLANTKQQPKEVVKEEVVKEDEDEEIQEEVEYALTAEDLERLKAQEAQQRKIALMRARAKLSKALHDQHVEDAVEAVELMLDEEEPVPSEHLAALLRCAAQTPDAERFARAVSAAQRGKVTLDEQTFAALVGTLLANEAPHALVRCVLNFGLPPDGHFIPLIPYEIRPEEIQDVFRAATNDDSGELDLDLRAETDVPPMLEFAGCRFKPDLNGLYQRQLGRKDLLGHERPIYQKQMGFSRRYRCYYWDAALTPDETARDKESGWYIASEIGGGHTFARCVGTSEGNVPPKQGWSFTDSKENWIREASSGFIPPTSRTERIQALNLTEEESKTALEGVDLDALRGSVQGRDPEVCKYFCHFFILLCLELMSEIQNFRSRWRFRSLDQLVKFGIAFKDIKAEYEGKVKESKQAPLPGWPSLDTVQVHFSLPRDLKVLTMLRRLPLMLKDLELDEDAGDDSVDATDAGGSGVSAKMAELTIASEAAVTPSSVAPTPCPSPRGGFGCMWTVSGELWASLGHLKCYIHVYNFFSILFPRHLFQGKPVLLDMQSTEKVYKHDLEIIEGVFECRICGVMARKAEIITAHPCSKRGRSSITPGKLELEPQVRLIEFTPDWPAKVHDMIAHRLDETWELIHQDGAKTRLVYSEGEFSCERIPTTLDFPVMVAVVPKEQIMKEELEKLELEENLLTELLLLKELEEEESKEIPSEESDPNAASSHTAPPSLEPAAETPVKFAAMVTTKILGSPDPVTPGKAAGEPSGPRPTEKQGIPNPGVVRELMYQGMSKEDAIAKVSEGELSNPLPGSGEADKKDLAKDTKRETVPENTEHMCAVHIKVKEEVCEEEEKGLELGNGLEEGKEKEEVEDDGLELGSGIEAGKEKEAVEGDMGQDDPCRPSILDCLAVISPKEQAKKGKAVGRGKGKGRGRGKKRKASSDDSEESETEDDEEAVTDKTRPAKSRARSSKKPTKGKGKGDAEEKKGSEEVEEKGSKQAEKKKKKKEGTQAEPKRRAKKAKNEEVAPKAADEEGVPAKKRRSRSKKVETGKVEDQKVEKTCKEKIEHKQDDKKAETGEENAPEDKPRRSRKSKKAQDAEEKTAAGAGDKEGAEETKGRRKRVKTSTEETETKAEKTEAKEHGKRKADESPEVKERKAQRSRKSSAYCAARKKALEDGLSEAEAKEKGRIVSKLKFI